MTQESAPFVVESEGFCDLQVNGFAGVDFNQPGLSDEQLARATAALRATGVTRYLATLITSSFEDFSHCARALSGRTDRALLGIHMEGPYISTGDARGAHSIEHIISASIDDFERRQEAAEGRIALVTLAPEVPGALRLIEHLVASGIRVAIGHTNASPEEVRDAVKAGATLSTHLGNGCVKLLPRHPNHLWEQLASDGLFASFIADGHHLSAATLKCMVRAKSPSRTILVTDATSAAASPAGLYTLGRLKIEGTSTGYVSSPGGGRLAGSALTLHRAVGIAVRDTGLPFEDVLPMVSTRPAAFLGVQPAGHVSAEWNPHSKSLRVLRVELD